MEENKYNLKVSLYEDLQSILQVFTINNLSDEIVFFSFDEFSKELSKLKKEVHHFFESSAIITKKECEKVACEDIKRRILLRKKFFKENKKDNIATKIGLIYQNHILEQLEKIKEQILIYYEKNNMFIPYEVIELKSVDDSFVKINFKSRQKIESNICEKITSYINKKILPFVDYGKIIKEDYLIIEYKVDTPLALMNVSPLEETFRKLTGYYKSWSYYITDESREELNKLVNHLAKTCADDFYSSGYLQDIEAFLLDDLKIKLKEVNVNEANSK